MKTRMQPIGNAWNKLPRLVRDLAPRNGQEDRAGHARRRDRARPPGAGADQGSADPHGAQLAAITGWRSPAERRAAGKPETGRITLNAFHEGGHIIIEIADDGRGLPVDKIRAKVLSQRPGDRGRTRRA